MIIAGYEYRGKKPFRDVYLTGLVRDQQRRKMSKSLGNSPEPLDLIEKYGADGVRVGMMLCSPAGNDLLYDNSLPEQGRNFANKIWNAFRLVKSWKVDEGIPQPESSLIAVKWIEEILKKSLGEIDSNFKRFRISEALMNCYKLFWDEFSGWYLEIIKPEYKQPVDRISYNATISVFDYLLRIIHPFMPFITEEIWQLIGERKEGESLMISSMPKVRKYDKELLSGFENAKETVTAIRAVRKEMQIQNRDPVELSVRADRNNYDTNFLSVVIKLCNLSEVGFTSEKPDNAASFMIRTTEFHIPLGGKVDVENEKAKINTELSYSRGFLDSVMKKLNNERFVLNAPQPVLDLERKKKADTESKIKSLEEALKGLSGKK
jgi:valyl-tRNA synthetase